MIDYFNTHLYAFWFAVGFALLSIELLVLGFATGFILFLGIAALVTGGLIWLELIPHTWLASIASFSFSSIVLSVILWKPFKNLERGRGTVEKDNTSDLIGLQFRLESGISITQPGLKRYSGIDWHVEIDANCNCDIIEAGTLVTVVSVDAGKFRVVPAVTR